MSTSKRSDPSKLIFEVVVVTLLSASLSCDAAQKTSQVPAPINVTAVTGVAVELKCKVRLQVMIL
jgi:hypothetical protein